MRNESVGLNRDPNAKRDFMKIYLTPGTPVSRATLQDYAGWANRNVYDWVLDAIVWFEHECDRQGAHAEREREFEAALAVEKAQYEHEHPTHEWRKRLAERLMILAEKIGCEEDC